MLLRTGIGRPGRRFRSFGNEKHNLLGGRLRLFFAGRRFRPRSGTSPTSAPARRFGFGARARRQDLNPPATPATEYRKPTHEDPSIPEPPGSRRRTLHEMVLGTPEALKEHAELMKKHPGMEHDEPSMTHVKPGATGEIVGSSPRRATSGSRA